MHSPMCNLQEKTVVKPPAQLWKKKGLDESKFWFLLPGQLHFMFTQANLYLMSYKVYMFVCVTVLHVHSSVAVRLHRARTATLEKVEEKGENVSNTHSVIHRNTKPYTCLVMHVQFHDWSRVSS